MHAIAQKISGEQIIIADAQTRLKPAQALRADFVWALSDAVEHVKAVRIVVRSSANPAPKEKKKEQQSDRVRDTPADGSDSSEDGVKGEVEAPPVPSEKPEAFAVAVRIGPKPLVRTGAIA